MDDGMLPLDMTIYGAIHQHETRKLPESAVPSSMFWSTVYTVKYKKVDGPMPVQDSKLANNLRLY
jgi:E3 ubiquitin-protein ligase TRIP12